ncbi:MAG: L-2-hydroxyglutarate oxidase [SAR202 cluster bacterium]|nr:L-2-hydroxyglutarate oxidase [SAR202 cluster bacterium]
MTFKSYDVAVVGGGIVGLAIARELSQRFPKMVVGLVEKESEIGQHQTGHNSGVIHSGLYYQPGSFKAQFCVDGAERMKQYCTEHGIEFDVCGKLVVATDEEELPRLQNLFERGIANGVQGIEMIEKEQIGEYEPHTTGLKAIVVPTTGIVDYQLVASSYATEIQEHGSEINTDAEVLDIETRAEGLVLNTTAGDIEAKHLINAAGLHVDVIARMLGVPVDIKIIPFRGEYYMLREDREHLVNNLIYPVPDPAFPFLGVHFTRTIHGEREAGPNAVLAFAREGYTRTTFNMSDMAGTFRFPGFWAMTRKYWKMGAGEFYRSASKRAFVKALQKLMPEITESDLVPGHTGVRAQALDRKGNLLSDFSINETRNAIHIRNAPSPAATSSLAIGEYVGNLAEKSFDLVG